MSNGKITHEELSQLTTVIANLTTLVGKQDFYSSEYKALNDLVVSLEKKYGTSSTQSTK